MPAPAVASQRAQAPPPGAPELAAVPAPVRVVPSEVVPPAPAAEPVTRFRVVDVATQVGVPALTLGWVSSMAEADLPARADTEVEGWITTPTTALGSLHLLTTGWRLLRHQAQEIAEGGSCWVAREVTLRVIVRADPKEPTPLDVTTVEVRVVPSAGLPSGDPSSPQGDFGSVAWMQAHGVKWAPAPVFPGTDGVADVAALRVPAMAVKAMAPGWMAAVTPVEWPAGSDATTHEIYIALHRSPRLTGLVVDPDGKPVSGAKVRVQTLREVPSWAEFRRNYSSYLIPGAAMMGHTGKDGRAYVGYAFGATTDAQGRFVVHARDPFKVTIAVHASGMVPGWMQLGDMREDADARIVIARYQGAPVRVTQRGIPLRRMRGMLLDVTDEHMQVPVSVATDADGALLGEWLVIGRGYHIRFGDGEQEGFMRWDGREHLELSELEKSYERFFGYEK
jgi:microcompartment protein CcmK/EutM